MHSQIVPFGVCVAITLRDISERKWLQQRLESRSSGCAMRIWLWRHSNSNWRQQTPAWRCKISTSIARDMNDRLVRQLANQKFDDTTQRVVSMTLCNPHQCVK